MRETIKLVDFVSEWIEHPNRSTGRNNLDSTDEIWEKFYLNDAITKYNKSYPIELLYRVHTGMLKPNFEHYTNMFSGNSLDEIKMYFEDDLTKWQEFNKKYNTPIVFDNHWVSFTKSIDTIGCHYFSEKNLRGKIIVMKPSKYIDISELPNSHNFEHEVVAPLVKENVIEVIDFEDFFKKYGKGTSDYEKRLR